MRYHLYASRPVPPGDGWPGLIGNAAIERDLRDRRDYLFIGPYEGAEHAVSSLLFHAERRTVNWAGQGWSEDINRDDITYELGRARLRSRRPLARITPDGIFQAATPLTELLPGRALDSVVITYTNAHTTQADHAPTRVPTLTRLIYPGEHLPPLSPQGATA